MPHPLVEQLRFTRSEWARGLEGVSDEDAARHFGPMNAIGWIVGHLAWQEQRYFLERAQNKTLFPELNASHAYGAPKSSPALSGTLPMWQEIIRATDPYLDSLTPQTLLNELLFEGKSVDQTIGSSLLRVAYHYWFHLGEIMAIRQMLGHPDLPEYVGHIDDLAPYRP